MLVAGAALVAGPALAQAGWPDRPVSVVNPFAAGGFTDGFGRTVFQQMQRTLGQPLVVDYRPGAGATLGASHVARSAADGYTLLYSPTTAWVLAPYLYRNPGYDPLVDLTPIGIIAETPMVLCSRQALPFGNVAALVAAAKAAPGKYSIANAGTGSLPHIMATLLASVAGIDINHVPYRGGGPAMNDLVAGHVDLFWEAIPNVTQHVEAGRVHALMISGEARAPALPQVPTVTQAGFPALNLTSWIALGGPAGLPASVVATLNRAMNAALASPEVRETMQRLSLVAVGGAPAVMAERMRREGAVYKRIITEGRMSSE
jgi:tripartite-type tricarboxylate transporter receptor subunit TctC